MACFQFRHPNLIEGQPPRRRPLYPIAPPAQPLFAKTLQNFQRNQSRPGKADREDRHFPNPDKRFFKKKMKRRPAVSSILRKPLKTWSLRISVGETGGETDE